MIEWPDLRIPPPDELAELRVQLHWAVQPMAAASRACAEPRDDDSHTALFYDADRSWFLTETYPSGRRVALDVDRATLLVKDLELPLEGCTLQFALDWLAGHLDARLELPTYDMPEHAVRTEAAFALGPAEVRSELCRWYSGAARLLCALQAGIDGASPVRCWPHHFDIAFLVSLDAERSIGVGMSPGDDSYAEPYFYCNPWPMPASVPELPLAGEGHWHPEGWIGAVLPATRLTGQAEQARAFLESALESNRRLLSTED